MPLAGCAAEEDRSECDREKPPQHEGAHSRAAQRGHRKVDGQTAGEQTDREEDRGVEHLLGQRARQALADVEEIGDDEDREDRRLGGDQAVHSDATPRREEPIATSVSGMVIAAALMIAYSYFQSGSSGCLRSHSGRRLRTRGRPRSCTPAAATRWTIRASTHPRDRFPRARPEIRPDQVADEHQHAGRLKEHADRHDQIPGVPPAPGLVGVDAARHAENPGNVHEIERQMEADDEQPEVQLAERLAVHPARDISGTSSRTPRRARRGCRPR